jgi:hypothetical protein
MGTAAPTKKGAVPRSEYERFPRGQLPYNEKTGKYTLLAVCWILGEKSLVGAILERMHSPVGETKTATDSHYRCYRCLGRSHQERVRVMRKLALHEPRINSLRRKNR